MVVQIVKASQNNPIYYCENCAEVRFGSLTKIEYYDREDFFSAIAGEVDDEFFDYDMVIRAVNLDSVREESKRIRLECPSCEAIADDYEIEQISVAWQCGRCGGLFYYECDAESCSCDEYSEPTLAEKPTTVDDDVDKLFL